MPGAATRWQLAPAADPGAIDALAGALGIHPQTAHLLTVRGHGEASAARAFLRPSLADMPDPFGMADAEVAAGRLSAAIRSGESVCVYGDYDVDGVSASALLVRFLRAVGAAPRVFLPDRFRDGYGLNRDRLLELVDHGVRLFVSVDCGVTAVDTIAAVRQAGADFIVCDHHQLAATLPPATAILNPLRPDCTYPDKGLSAVGVALVLAQATRRRLAEAGYFGERRPPALGVLLEYAALGTIADMVPLVGLNRALAWHGLRRLGCSELPGVQAMLAGLKDAAQHRAEHVGFELGPRINAAGRLADARTAFELLTTDDRARADELAGLVDAANNERREITRDVEAEALERAAQQPGHEHAVVVAADGWHAGVVGIVAARVREAFGVPTFILGIEDGLARGSGRAPKGFDLVAGLRACHASAARDEAPLFERFGGHAAAAGVTMRAEQIERFRAALVEHTAAVWPPAARTETIRIDGELRPEDIDLALLDAVDALEPFGRGNPKPRFLLRDVQLDGLRRVGRDKTWCQATVMATGEGPAWTRERVRLFGPARRFEAVSAGDRLDMVVELGRNAWRGQVTPQVWPIDLAPAGTRAIEPGALRAEDSAGEAA